MYDDLANIHYTPIRIYKYASFFEDIQYNGKTLSDVERGDYLRIIDETIADYAEALSFYREELERIRESEGEYYELDREILSMSLFVTITMIDSMVASKYFIMADKDYDRRFMRGKLYVIINEGFKKLYGFNKETYKKSEWDRLLPWMNRFPESINLQYQEVTYYLEKHAQTSSWWRDERNYETHLLAKELYDSRQEDLIESKVMIDSMKLFRTLMAVNSFMSNVHACLRNALVEKYLRGELKDE